MLDIRWLEDLAAIAEYRNLTKAAEKRNVTQSGLSRRLQSLERWVGALLIDRSKNPIYLTKAGEELLAISSDVIGRLNGTRRAIRDEADKKLAAVRFAAPHALSVTFFPKWLPVLQRQVGPLPLNVRSDNLSCCCDALENGDVDFVVCFIDAQSDLNNGDDSLPLTRCDSILVGRDRLVPLSVPDRAGEPRHRLTGDSETEVPYLGYEAVCTLGRAVDGVIGRNGSLSRLRLIFENAHADGLRSMTLLGMGVAWLPLSMTHNDILNCKLVRAGPEPLDVNLQVRVFRANRDLPKRSEAVWREMSAQSLTARTKVSGPSDKMTAGGHAVGF
ncbi:LysR family transcriptional regulator [Rhizobium laguerreae]|uniref:LysR family transcriptional regulator n=1 Tax=Rhizobium laguerreae TaxID=1076926 RepID=UPI001C91BBAF|nr:LysR family transcriptional regulator [Rhizobium laguerreae]MBY3088907.1 LysR family transcriptional regulator [Rhizobium laguerreae]MBY3150615.1 LysR family transcriptional regulator [Rhizobium laguerreae]